MGSTRQKLERILQTKEEQKNFLKNVSEINDETPFKDYLPIIKRLISSTFNVSIPLTSSKLNYSGITNPPENIAVSYNTGFSQTNVFNIQNIPANVLKTADNPHFNVVPSALNSFNNAAWVGENKNVDLLLDHYYGFMFEFETECELSTANDLIAFHNTATGTGANNTLNATRYRQRSGNVYRYFQVVHHINVSLSFGTIIWRIFTLDPTDVVSLTASSMYMIDFGAENITAEEMAKQYPTYFENTAHSKFKVLNKSHNILTEVYEGRNASSNVILPFFNVKMGEPLSVQAKINVTTGTTENGLANVRFQRINSSGEYYTVAVGNNIPLGQEGISKIENYLPTEDVAMLRIIIAIFNGATIDYSDVQLEVSEKCNEYAPHFEDEDLGNYELTGQEETKDIERYCWFEPHKGGYLQFEAIDNSLIPQLNTSTLDYYVELTNTQIAEALSILNTEKEE